MAFSKFGGLMVALTLLSATAVTAQQGEQRRGTRPGVEQQGGGPMGMLFRGIELSSDQETRIQAIMQQYRPAGRGIGRGEGMGQAQRPGVERGDSARAGRGQGRPGMQRGDSTRVRGERPERRERGDSARAGRPDRDAAGAIRPDAGNRAQFEGQREQMIRDVRAVLTTQQRVVFDRNVQEMEQRMEQRVDQRVQQRPRGATGIRG